MKRLIPQDAQRDVLSAEGSSLASSMEIHIFLKMHIRLLGLSNKLLLRKRGIIAAPSTSS
jgi:hypothetical protein